MKFRCALALLTALLPLSGCVEQEPAVYLSEGFPVGIVTHPGHIPAAVSHLESWDYPHFKVHTSKGTYRSNGQILFNDSAFGTITFQLSSQDNNIISYVLVLAKPECSARMVENGQETVFRKALLGQLSPERPLVEVHAPAPCKAEFTMRRGTD